MVEVKRAGRVRKGHESGAGDEGGDIRFRDAERMFRNSAALVEDAPAPFLPLFAQADDAPEATAPAPERRILPDLIAEAAALSEQAPEPDAPRRRGRPPKNRDGELHAARPAALPYAKEDVLLLESDDGVHTFDVTPMMLDAAASARRRLARDTSRLPRAQRWKRRLPRVCW